MTSQSQRVAAVTPVARPPVRQSTLVRSDRRHTFEVFVRTIGIWWPVNPFSAGRERTRDVTFEQREGGRVYETWGDGTQVDWGSLLAWQPPERFVMTWNMTSVATEVELTFAELGPALTRVAVEHRGWERLTDDQLAEDCALPGGYASGAFTKGWAQILGCLSAAAEGTAAEGTAADATAAEATAAKGTAADETAAGSAPGNGPERDAGNSSGNAGGLA
jgi:uncharacterized protein YndB with AHSA1/START domain